MSYTFIAPYCGTRADFDRNIAAMRKLLAARGLEPQRGRLQMDFEDGGHLELTLLGTAPEGFALAYDHAHFSPLALDAVFAIGRAGHLAFSGQDGGADDWIVMNAADATVAVGSLGAVAPIVIETAEALRAWFRAA